ncbi:MAG: DedA family protein [Prevotella sp.]|nr:DedA family protein [Prevotella sp.]
MQAVIDLLTGYGYWGMLVAAFLAGSFFPFSSEAVMLALLAAGLDANGLIVYGSIGNVLGSMFNYAVGRMGNLEWIERYLHVKKADLDKARRFMAGRGAWMGFFAFIPFLGSAITILLGLMRANIPISFTSITIGKVLRYIVLIYGAKGIAALF